MTAVTSTAIASTRIVMMPVIRIEREIDGDAWLVLTPRGHGWSFGDRSAALTEKAWHDRQGY